MHPCRSLRSYSIEGESTIHLVVNTTAADGAGTPPPPPPPPAALRMPPSVQLMEMYEGTTREQASDGFGVLDRGWGCALWGFLDWRRVVGSWNL